MAASYGLRITVGILTMQICFSVDDDPSTRVVINRSVLPTAPRSALGANVDLSRVPKEKPFTAFLANLPFEVSDEDIHRFFKDLNVIGIC